MTSEIEQGPELFETPQPSVDEASTGRKSTKRIIRRRSADSSQQVVVKVKQVEPILNEVIEPLNADPKDTESSIKKKEHLVQESEKKSGVPIVEVSAPVNASEDEVKSEKNDETPPPVK
ncbi:MAG: hypothetical protein WDA14_08900, partial [Sphaerochaetaceae bacterium]